MLNLYTLDAKLGMLGGIKQQTPFMQRVLATKKGRMVLACAMKTPLKFCSAPTKYIDDIIYRKIKEDWLNPEQFEEYKNLRQKEIMQSNMKSCGLTEEDMKITEENLIEWEKKL